MHYLDYISSLCKLSWESVQIYQPVWLHQ